VPQETRDNGNGLAVIIKQFKGYLVAVALLNALDSHRLFSPSNTGRFHSKKRVICVCVGGKLMRKEERGQKCLHNSETPFERRFQALLRQAWLQRSWHVIVAEPGSGKTMGIGDLRDEAARQAGMVGGRRYPILAVTAPKNDPREAALGNLLLLALGVGSRGRWSERKYLLYDLLGQYGVECLICDDAHDLSMPHLIFFRYC
jgi:hypothetical protein